LRLLAAVFCLEDATNLPDSSGESLATRPCPVPYRRGRPWCGIVSLI